MNRTNIRTIDFLFKTVSRRDPDRELPPVVNRSLLTRTLLLTVFIVLSSFTVATAGEKIGDLKALMTPPDDTVQAEEVRIWLPLSRVASCRVIVNVYDDSSRVIRHLLNQVLRSGYYNFYWDKKDDSGRLVDEGVYRYVADLCGHEREGTVTAEYKAGERLCILYPESDSLPGTVLFDLLEDSLVVSASINNWAGGLTETLLVDSLMTAGRHRLQWKPPGRVIPSRYRVHLRLLDFVHKTEIHKPR